MSLASHQYQQVQIEPKSQYGRRQEEIATKDSRLPPSEFEEPSSAYTFWFDNRLPGTSGSIKETGRYVDLRCVIPIAAMVCLVSVIPLIVYAATRNQMADITYANENDTYDCSLAKKASKDALSGDLAINLIVFKNLSFTAAKAIDLAWNLLVGRGFQAIAAFICYRLFTGILYLILEQQSVSADTFSALAFYTTSLWSCGPIIKTMRHGKLGLSNAFAVAWILVSITYLLFVVTMADLMTGYVTGEMTWLKFPNGTMMETGSINETSLNIILADQLRHSPPENVTMPDNSTISPDWTAWYALVPLVPSAIVPSSPGSTNGTMLFEKCLNVEEMGLFYVDAYLDPRPTKEGRWYASGDYRYQDTPREKVLTKYPAESCLDRYMLGLQDLFQQPNYSPNMTWWRNETNFRCLPSTDYAWGFSYQYTILLTSINSIWLLITAALWLHVEIEGQFLQKRGPMGTWRAVLDLASAAQEKLGHDAGGYTEVGLEKAVKTLQPLAYDIHAGEATGMDRIVLREYDGNDGWRKERFRLRWKTKYC